MATEAIFWNAPQEGGTWPIVGEGFPSRVSGLLSAFAFIVSKDNEHPHC